MKLTTEETLFLTALAREQNQTGCRGPAHDLLRQHAYPTVPTSGPHSLAFSYEAVPLTSLLLQDYKDLQAIDDFLRLGKPIAKPVWPWTSAEEYQQRLAQARLEWEGLRLALPESGLAIHVSGTALRVRNDKPHTEVPS